MNTYTNSALKNVQSAFEDAKKQHGAANVALYYRGDALDAETGERLWWKSMDGFVRVFHITSRLFTVTAPWLALKEGHFITFGCKPTGEYTFVLCVNGEVPGREVLPTFPADWSAMAEKTLADAREGKQPVANGSGAAKVAKTKTVEPEYVAAARKKVSGFEAAIEALPEGDPVRVAIEPKLIEARSELDAALLRADEERKAAEEAEKAAKAKAARDHELAQRVAVKRTEIEASIAAGEAEMTRLGELLESDDDTVADQAKADRKVKRAELVELRERLERLPAEVEAAYDAELARKADDERKAAETLARTAEAAARASLADRLREAAELLRANGWDVAAPYAHDGSDEGTPLTIEVPAKTGKAKAKAEAA